jgi:hypothetical protein
MVALIVEIVAHASVMGQCGTAVVTSNRDSEMTLFSARFRQFGFVQVLPCCIGNARSQG